jgi:hypothetical protein
LAATSVLKAVVASFQNGVDGYAGAEDTSISRLQPNRNMNGQSIRIEAKQLAKGLLRFDNIFGSGQGQIPYGSQILGVYLGMYNAQDHLTAGGAPATLHRLLEPWDPATATWNSLDHGKLAMDPASDGTIGSAQRNGYSAAVHTHAVQTVQAWSNGEANYGWVLERDSAAGYSQNGGAWLAGNETAADPRQRPFLSVEYVPPPQPASDRSGRRAAAGEGSTRPRSLRLEPLRDETEVNSRRRVRSVTVR